MFRQFLPNLSLLIKMKGRKYALNMNAGRCGLAHVPTCPSPSVFPLLSFHNVYGCCRHHITRAVCDGPHIKREPVPSSAIYFCGKSVNVFSSTHQAITQGCLWLGR